MSAVAHPCPSPARSIRPAHSTRSARSARSTSPTRSTRPAACLMLLFACATAGGVLQAQTKAPYSVEPLGAAMQSVNVRSADFGTLPDGTPAVFAASNGEPVTFNVLSLRDGSSIFSQAIEGETLAGAVSYSPADNSAYFGVSQATPGALFRYTPEQGVVRVADRLQGQAWLRQSAADADGRLYLSTYPDVKLLAYNPQTGVTDDYGSARTDVTYGWSVGIVDDEVWVGTGPQMYLQRFNKTSGENHEVPLSEKYRGQTGYVVGIEKRGDYVLVRFTGGGDTLVYDLQTDNWLRTLEAVDLSGTTLPDSEGNIYYLSKRKLLQHNLQSGQTQETAMAQTAAGRALRGKSRSYDIALLSIDGKQAVVGLTNTGKIWRYFIDEQTGDVLEAQIQPSAAKLVGFGAGPDGNLYMGAKVGAGLIARLHPQDNRIEVLDGPSQAEGVGGSGDVIVFGEYTSAVVHVGDLSKPWQWGKNPQRMFKLGRGAPYYQDRVWAIEPAGEKIALGTIPEPGQNGGALVLMDAKSGDFTLHRDVVPAQSILALKEKDGLLYGTTSIHGGSGTEPLATEAALFIWDVAEGKKIWQGQPVAGATIIGSICLVDDSLWGITEDGDIFEFSLAERKVLRRAKVTPQEKYRHPWGNHSSLVYDEDADTFVGTAGQTLFAMNRQTLQPQPIEQAGQQTDQQAGSILRVRKAGNGNIYGISETDVFFIRRQQR